jgi:hypothetical protein
VDALENLLNSKFLLSCLNSLVNMFTIKRKNKKCQLWIKFKMVDALRNVFQINCLFVACSFLRK